MESAEMIALASPPCHECGMPVQRCDMIWRKVYGLFSPGEIGSFAWELEAHVVCAAGHRVRVEPLT